MDAPHRTSVRFVAESETAERFPQVTLYFVHFRSRKASLADTAGDALSASNMKIFFRLNDIMAKWEGDSTDE